MSSSLLTCNQQQLAKGFGVSTRTIQQWDRDGMAEASRMESKGRSAKYDAFAAMRWYHEREMAQLRETLAGTDDEMERAKLRKLEAEAESKELDVRVKRGELVPLDEVERLVREALEAIDSVLRHVPSRFAPALARSARIAVKESRTILRDVVESVRAAIREMEGSP